jgi:hypothetical protein
MPRANASLNVAARLRQPDAAGKSRPAEIPVPGIDAAPASVPTARLLQFSDPIYSLSHQEQSCSYLLGEEPIHGLKQLETPWRWTLFLAHVASTVHSLRTSIGHPKQEP